ATPPPAQSRWPRPRPDRRRWDRPPAAPPGSRPARRTTPRRARAVPPRQRQSPRSAGSWLLLLVAPDGSFPATQRVGLIDGGAFEALHRDLAVGPDDLDPVHAVRLAQADVDPRVVAAQVARAGIQPAQITAPPREDRHLGPVGIAVALRIDEPQDQPVAALRDDIAIQPRRPRDRGD